MVALTELGAAEAAAAIRAGDVSAQALVEALLDRCARAVPLNAFISLDPDAVRAAARVADQRRRRGERLGALHGVPLVLKDNFDTADFPTTAGTPALAAHRPRRNGAVVQRLLDAGALILGKANMQELAFGPTSNNAAFGPVHNPYDRSRIPGGSSGGTGARSRLGSRPRVSAPTPAVRCGGRPPRAASSDFVRPRSAGRRRALCRSRTRATRRRRWHAALPTACCSTASSPGAP